MEIPKGNTPFYWRQRKKWYLKIVNEGGKRSNLYLGNTKTEAMTEFNRLIRSIADESAAAERASEDPLFIRLADEWAVYQRKRRDRGEVSSSWLDNRERLIGQFLCHKHNAELHCSEVTPVIVRRWVESRDWKPDTERTAISTIRQVLNWGVRQKIISESQLTGIEMPTGRHRDFIVSPWLHVRMMAKASKPARYLIEALRLTGCRPNEIRAVRIEDVAADYSCFVLRAHKNARKTGKVRTVFLSSGARKLFRVVIADRKEGFVFLDRHGKQFTQNAIRCIFRRLREKLDLGEDEPVNSYSFRHTWATNALMKGIPVATVAELMGNSVKMVEKHYGHLAKQPRHLLEMMERAV